MLDTCRRISSIEVIWLLSRGFGSPSTSHRIFGFRVARARFFFVLWPATQRIASYVLLYENQVSPSWKYGSMEMRGGWKTRSSPAHFPAGVYAEKMKERKSDIYSKINRAGIIK